MLTTSPALGHRLPPIEGNWIDAEVIPNSFVVNTGDVQHRWTNGRFLSTPHRAFNTSQSARYAIPVFFHPNPDTLIDCLPGCAVAGEAPRFPAMTTADHMAWFRARNYNHVRKEKGEAPDQAAPAAAAE